MPGAVVALCVLLVGACSDGDDPGAERRARPYVDALADGLALADPLDLDLTTEQATCVAKRWIDALDPDELRKSDVTPGDLDDADGADAALEDADEEQAGRLFAAYDPCEVDVRAEFMRRVQADLTTADATCLEEGISDDMVRKVAVDEMIDAHDAAVTTELFEALASCSGPGPEP